MKHRYFWRPNQQGSCSDATWNWGGATEVVRLHAHLARPTWQIKRPLTL
jgi:hypothetical protein